MFQAWFTLFGSLRRNNNVSPQDSNLTKHGEKLRLFANTPPLNQFKNKAQIHVQTEFELYSWNVNEEKIPTYIGSNF